MKKILKTITGLFALSSVSCLLFTSFSFSQEMPKPGEVINKGNYKKYVHVFPAEFLQGFEDGFVGLWKPFEVKVVETQPASQPKGLLALSEKNRGKFTIDKDGFIAGGYDYVGLPFPGITKDDKDFVTKFMYNYNYRYSFDDFLGQELDCKKRGSESLVNVECEVRRLSFINRLVDAPKPTYENPVKLQSAMVINYKYPPSWRNKQTTWYKYLDQRKSDDLYAYVPTIRRIVRIDASQSSTPSIEQISAPDDLYGGFNGKLHQFTYKLLGEQKVLGARENNMNVSLMKKLQAEGGNRYLPFPSDSWELRDVCVIEILSKDPKYPQSRKVVYIDKDNLRIYYAIAWDRAGKLWKVWSTTWRTVELLPGEKTEVWSCRLSVDVQAVFGTSFTFDFRLNGNALKYSDFLPEAMIARGM